MMVNFKEEIESKGCRPIVRFSLRWLNLFADLLRLPVLSLRSKTPLAAENLFLRKQLAFYQERKIRPRRIDIQPT